MLGKGISLEKAAIALLALIMILGIWARLYNLGEFITHTDDLSVATTILYKTYDFASLHALISDQQQATYSHPIKQALRALDSRGILEPAYGAIRPLVPYVIIPLKSSYAPLQFILDPLLLSKGASYRSIVLLGRIPSFLSSALCLFALAYFWKKAGFPHYLPHALLSISLLAFSFESVIYAKQMENISIGVLAVTALFALLLFDLKKPMPSLGSSAASAIAPYAQYTAIFFLPAYFAANFARMAKEHGTPAAARLLARPLALFLLLSIPSIFLMAVVASNYRSIHWNAGRLGEFAFSLPEGGVFSRLLYIPSFFIGNFALLSSSHASFIPPSSPMFLPLGYALVLLCIAGMARLLFSKGWEFYLGIFTLVSGAAIASLVVAGKLALSPTRHTLVLLPFIAILAPFGFFFLAGIALSTLKIKGKNTLLSISVILCLAMAFLFVSGMDEVFSPRIDKFSEGSLASLLESYEVDAVFTYLGTPNPVLMKEVWAGRTVIDVDNDLILNSKGKYGTVAFIGSQFQFQGEFADDVFKKSEKLGVPILSYSDFEIIHQQHNATGIQVEFANYTDSGNSDLYITIMRKKS